MEKYAVIVDAYHIPYEDSRGFASAFRNRGVTPIVVLSTPTPIEAFRPRWFPDDFAEVHYYKGDFESLVKTVEGYDPICIVPGLETGVELAARLVDTLMPEKGNVPGSALAQRDKGEMVAALARAGVPHLKTIRATDPDDVARWIQASGLEGRPLVLKPPKSGGTDSVYRVPGGDDWRPVFDRLLGGLNHYGVINEAVIVQEYATGDEYIVDLYSVSGNHGLVDVCVYAKHNRGVRLGIYDLADFVSPDKPEVAALFDYTARAADAVGIRNGSTHAEVMLTPDGPRLIELAARYSGSCMMISGQLATGDNQIERTVRHYLDGQFTPGYRLRGPVRTLWLCAQRAGVVRDIETIADAELPTARCMSLPPNGRVVPRTVDMSTSLGWIIQAAPEWSAIEADYRRIRRVEAELRIDPVEPGVPDQAGT